MFWGKQNRCIDNRNRLTFAERLRDELGKEPIVIKFRNHLRIYPEGEEKRFKPSQLWKLKFDGHGRILIPTILLRSIPYGLETNNVVLSGEGDYLKLKPQK